MDWYGEGMREEKEGGHEDKSEAKHLSEEQLLRCQWASEFVNRRS